MEDMVSEVVEEVVEPSGEGTEPEGGTEATPTPEDPYSSKSSREYSQWLKGLRDSGDPMAAKYARLAKDNHGQLFALRQLEKAGIDGVREKYALLDSVIHNDPERGELKGADAIAALQDSVRGYAELDEQIAAGDPKALESLGEEFNGGLAKLAPAILDRVAQSDPEAYAAAVLPHFVKALAQSELVSSFNGLVDVLNEAPPRWLTPEQKTAWAADQQQKVIALAGKMGGWLNAQADKAGKLPQNGNVPRGTDPKKDALSEREAAFNKREQDAHWNSNISPKLDEHAGKSFGQLFQPYAKRLNLDANTTNALKFEFSKRVSLEAAKQVHDPKTGKMVDNDYIQQIKRYRAAKNPDPNTVLNYAKVNFDKHARTVMESLVNERYKPFLNGKPRGAQPGNTNGAGKNPPPAKGIQYVTTRPAEGTYDPRARSIDDIHKKIFRLKDGRSVQVRA